MIELEEEIVKSTFIAGNHNLISRRFIEQVKTKSVRIKDFNNTPN